MASDVVETYKCRGILSRTSNSGSNLGGRRRGARLWGTVGMNDLVVVRHPMHQAYCKHRLACRFGPTINPCCSSKKAPARIGPSNISQFLDPTPAPSHQQNNLWHLSLGLQLLFTLSLQRGISHNICLYVRTKVESWERCCFPRRIRLC